MITEDYVSFETAKLLKEKGFDVETEHKMWYVVKQFSTGCHWNSCTYKEGDITREYDKDYCISMPTLYMTIEWLRKEHNLHVFTIPVFEDVEYQPGEWQEEMTGYRYEIVNINPNSKIIKDYPKIRALTPESAYEAAIKYCLENLI